MGGHCVDRNPSRHFWRAMCTPRLGGYIAQSESYVTMRRLGDVVYLRHIQKGAWTMNKEDAADILAAIECVYQPKLIRVEKQEEDSESE